MPVGKQTTFRNMISKAAQHALENDYLNVTAFLVPKPTRMFTWHYPKEYPKPLTTPLTIEKASYGLKTAPRLWNKTNNAFLSNSSNQKLIPIYIYTWQRQC